MPAQRRTCSARRARARRGKLSRVRSGVFAFPFTGKLASVLGIRRIPFHRSILRNTVCPDFRLERAMIETLTILLRVAGAGLILLAWLRVPIGRRLKWREEALLLSPLNASIFRVHTFFICFVLVRS